MRPFLSVYGHVSLDQIIKVDRFPRRNTSVDAIDKTLRLGGIATNISVVASSLGVPTAVCAFVGSDFPQDLEKFIKDRGVIMNEFVKIDGMDTSTAFIINDAEMNQCVCFLQGAQGCASSLGIDLLKNAKLSKAVHFSTGDPDYYIRLMGMIKGNARISFDPSQEIRDKWKRGRFRKALDLSDAFFCNEHEAEAAMRYLRVNSLSQIDKDMIVCTLGNKGSEAYINGEKILIPPVKPKKTVDPTGAGDAYRAGFYAGLFHGHTVIESLTIASATSSFIVEEVGALSNVPTWDQVMERADKEMRKQ